MHGIRGLASRWENDSHGAHFSRTAVVPTGGFRPLKGFFNGFAINAEMESLQISGDATMAGMLFVFAIRGGNKSVTDAMAALTKSFDEEDAKGIAKGIENLQDELIGAEDEVKAFFQKVMKDNQ